MRHGPPTSGEPPEAGPARRPQGLSLPARPRGRCGGRGAVEAPVGSGRGAAHHSCVDLQAPRGGPIAPGPCDREVEGEARDLAGLTVDRGQLERLRGRDARIVEAHHPDVLGDRQAGLPQGDQGALRALVVVADEGLRKGLRVDQDGVDCLLYTSDAADD